MHNEGRPGYFTTHVLVEVENHVGVISKDPGGSTSRNSMFAVGLVELLLWYEIALLSFYSLRHHRGINEVLESAGSHELTSKGVVHHPESSLCTTLLGQ